jgi:hypothetical protein
MRYQLLILLNGGADAGFLEMVRRAGLLDVLDVSERPPLAGLGLAGGRPTLSVSAPGKLFDWVERRESVPAFALAPRAELAALDGAVFVWHDRHLRVICRPDADAFGPYAARAVHLEYLGLAPARDLAPDAPVVVTGEPGRGPLMYADPLSVALRHQKAAAWFGRADRELAVSSAVCLPPWRLTPAAEGYFTPERLALRARLRALGRADEPGAAEPALLTLVRCADRPEVRDLLLDGGWLDLDGGAGVPTALGLRVWGLRDAGPVAGYRARFFADPKALTSAARAVAEACLHDLGALVPGGLRVAPASAPAAWAAAVPVGPGDPTGPTFGSWQVMGRLAEALDDDARALFERLVLRPARPRDGGCANHALAERAFVVNCAAGSGPSPGDDPVWRRAVCAHLLTYLDGAAPWALPERLSAEAAFGRFRLEQVGGAWRCVHLPECGADELRRLRLALPVGSSFVAETGAPAKPEPAVPADELLARLDLLDPASGLIAFTAGRSLLVAADADSLIVTARDLRGRTRTGRFIALGAEGRAVRLPLAGGGPAVLDAWIEAGADEPAQLHAQRVIEEDRPRVVPGPSCLDLGRWGWRPGVAPWLVRRPAVRTLAAIAPHDDAWRSYVAPLTEALDALIREDIGTIPAATAFAAKLARVAADWAVLPLPDLARRLAYLTHLRTWRPADGPCRTPAEPPRLDDVSGDDVPAALARLATPGLRRPERRQRRLEAGMDFVARVDGHALTLSFARDLPPGRLEVRAARPCPAVPPLMLAGAVVAQPLVPAGDGRPTYVSQPIVIRAGGELQISPLRHVWDAGLTVELWLVENSQ